MKSKLWLQLKALSRNDPSCSLTFTLCVLSDWLQGEAALHDGRGLQLLVSL